MGVQNQQTTMSHFFQAILPILVGIKILVKPDIYHMFAVLKLSLMFI